MRTAFEIRHLAFVIAPPIFLIRPASPGGTPAPSLVRRTDNRQLRTDNSECYRHIIKSTCIFLDHLDHLALAPMRGPLL
jgi:hypothetical protein